MFDKIILNCINNKENLLAHVVCHAPACHSKYIDQYILPYSILDKEHPIPFEIPENTLLIEGSALSPDRSPNINVYIECNDEDVKKAVDYWANDGDLPEWFTDLNLLRRGARVVTYGNLSEYKYVKIEVNKELYLDGNQLIGHYYKIGGDITQKLYSTLIEKCLNT